MLPLWPEALDFSRAVFHYSLRKAVTLQSALLMFMDISKNRHTSVVQKSKPSITHIPLLRGSVLGLPPTAALRSGHGKPAGNALP